MMSTGSVSPRARSVFSSCSPSLPGSPRSSSSSSKGSVPQHARGGTGIVHPVDDEALALQSRADRLADHRVVFYQQQSSRCASMINHARPSARSSIDRPRSRCAEPGAIERLVQDAASLGVTLERGGCGTAASHSSTSSRAGTAVTTSRRSRPRRDAHAPPARQPRRDADLHGATHRGCRHGRRIPGPAARRVQPAAALHPHRLDRQENPLRVACRGAPGSPTSAPCTRGSRS